MISLPSHVIVYEYKDQSLTRTQTRVGTRIIFIVPTMAEQISSDDTAE